MSSAPFITIHLLQFITGAYFLIIHTMRNKSTSAFNTDPALRYVLDLDVDSFLVTDRTLVESLINEYSSGDTSMENLFIISALKNKLSDLPSYEDLQKRESLLFEL